MQDGNTRLYTPTLYSGKAPSRHQSAYLSPFALLDLLEGSLRRVTRSLLCDGVSISVGPF
jgi:hypothetical protein